MPDPAVYDIMEQWYGRLGLAVVFGALLAVLVRWVISRGSRQEDRLRAELAARRQEDREERELKQKRDDAEREAMATRLRELEDSRFNEMKTHTAMVVKALGDCAVSNANNDRSRRKLDATLQGLTSTLLNLPCNRGTIPVRHHTPIPDNTDETPPHGTKDR